MDGGRGNDTLSGGAGNDPFVFAEGRETIEDFGSGDVVKISNALGVSRFADVLAIATTVGGGDDVLINFGGDNSLRLENVLLSALSESDFVFT
ncbi:MAG: hypothetical protein GJ676_10860 [Rhodobacteraceae bacterium]|nr:hypothetical protein [Paracoccaceae bacterium]